MTVVCELCGKSCSSITSTHIKDGYICTDCSIKMDGIIGKKANFSEITKSDLKEILKNPMHTKKVRIRVNEGKKNFCFGCGKLNACKYIDNEHGLCLACSMVVHTVYGKYDASEKINYSSHDVSWYKSELENCCSPKNDILFNFRTKRVFFMDEVSKKKYRLVHFINLLRYNVSASKAGVRFIDLDYKYNGATMRYHTDDSYEDEPKHMGEFDMLLECLSKIDKLEQVGQMQENSISSCFSQAQSNSNNMGVKCPGCGSTNCTPIVENSTSGKDFSVGKGCCGAILFGPIGILCGACGEGKQVTSNTYWICRDCGKKYMV